MTSHHLAFGSRGLALLVASHYTDEPAPNGEVPVYDWHTAFECPSFMGFRKVGETDSQARERLELLGSS